MEQLNKRIDKEISRFIVKVLSKINHSGLPGKADEDGQVVASL